MVAIKQPSIFHPVPLNVAIEKGFWMPDIVTIEDQCLTPIVIG